MTSAVVSLLVQCTLLAGDADTYADAHRQTTETGKPMVVMVGADWCPACVVMKDDVLPQVRRHGLLRRVAFAVVNLDREKELGSQLTEGGPIPQLLVYRKARNGWQVRRLVGGQDVATVEKFIAEDADAAEASPAVVTQPAGDKPAPAAAPPAPAAPPVAQTAAKGNSASASVDATVAHSVQ